MKLVIPGGTGQIGGILARAFEARGDEVVIVSRHGEVTWSDLARVIDGSDVVINLAGRSVNCRYTEANLDEMMRSRVDSTRAVGEAIAGAARPPRVWLQMSTATIYAHRFDAPNDEATGVIGGDEPDAPAYWAKSIEIAKAWERTLAEARTPRTRKVAMRAAMVMSPDRGGVFDVLLGMVRRRLGGAIGGGRQYVSWIHDRDLVRAIDFLIARDDLDGAINLASPGPLPQRDFMRALRDAWGAKLGLPATRWMAELGAFVLRTDTELLLKSRRVIPGILVEKGFAFDFPAWPAAAEDLVARRRALR